MARYTAESKERVREAADMVQVVSARTELRRSSTRGLMGTCPFHDERTPSFSVEPDKKLYHCFGCGAAGDVFTFVMETEGVDFTGALELLAERFGVELERESEDPDEVRRRRRRERLLEVCARAAAFYARMLWDAGEARPAREYLAARGLDEPVLRAFGIGYAPSAWDRLLLASRRAGFEQDELLAAGLVQRSRSRPGSVYDRFRERITFPLCDLRGRVLGFGARALRDNQRPKYLNTSEGELFHKGRQLFGADRARAAAARAGAVLVAEGYTDVLALHQAGLEHAVALMGTAMTPEQLAELGRMAGAGGRILLALDADAAGQEAMIRAARLARGRKLDLRVVPMPRGTDPADLVQRDGPERMRELVDGSVGFARFRVTSVLDAAPLDAPEARDRALGELRPTLAELPPSAEREDLVRLVASRLDLSEQVVSSIAAGAGGAARPAVGGEGGGGGDAPRGGGPGGGVHDRRDEAERAFLAHCIALPGPGAAALAGLDPERHFTSARTRMAARHLSAHLADPVEHLPPDAPELAAIVAELVVRAGTEPTDEASLEVEALQLDLRRLDREIAAARAARQLDVDRLATDREAVKRRYDIAIERATEPAG